MTPDQPHPTRSQVVGVRCSVCGYDLSGLSQGGICPECANPIHQSIQGNLLEYSEPGYVRHLYRGTMLIVSAIATQFVLGVVSFVWGLTGTMPTSANEAINIAGLIVWIVLLAGWWLFSTPDPAFVGVHSGSKARVWIRGSLLASVLINLIFAFLSLSGAQTQTGGAASVLFSLGLLALAVSAVQFFAAMLYLHWLAPRLPDEEVDARARRLMWLGPLLVTVGALIVVGPLIALVLYWNLLDRVRRHLKQIMLRQTSSG